MSLRACYFLGPQCVSSRHPRYSVRPPEASQRGYRDAPRWCWGLRTIRTLLRAPQWRETAQEYNKTLRQRPTQLLGPFKYFDRPAKGYLSIPAPEYQNIGSDRVVALA